MALVALGVLFEFYTDDHETNRHIDDFARLWLLFLETIIRGQGSHLPHGLQGGSYFGGQDRIAYDELSLFVASELYRRDQTDSPFPIPFKDKQTAARELQVSRLWVDIVFAVDINWIPEKATRVLGWTPKHDLNWLRDHFKEEVDAAYRHEAKGL